MEIKHHDLKIMRQSNRTSLDTFFKKYFELNDNENSTYQNLWNLVKAMLRQRVIALNAYCKEEKKVRSGINHLRLPLRKP